MSAETYLNLLNAVQEHIVDEAGADMYAPHWVIAAGIEQINGGQAREMLRVYKSPRTAPYVVSGLLDYALQVSAPDVELE